MDDNKEIIVVGHIGDAGLRKAFLMALLDHTMVVVCDDSELQRLGDPNDLEELVMELTCPPPDLKDCMAECYLEGGKQESFHLGRAAVTKMPNADRQYLKRLGIR